MRGPSGDNEICFENFEKALAKSPETYRHIDLIAFGFPCQDISNANPKGKGIKGPKSSIFFECMRIVKILNPAWLLVENVPRLLTINKGQDMLAVVSEMAESGYGWAYRILDSQYFGVPQRRKRIFIVGCLGKIPPPEILFEQKSGGGNDTKKRKIRQGGLCISTREGQRQDPTAETFIDSTIQATDYRKVQHGQFGNEGNLIASTIQSEGHGRNSDAQLIAEPLQKKYRGKFSGLWGETHIAEIDPVGKRKTSGIARGLDSARGVLIGNGVTRQVAEWIAKRIIKYGQGTK